MALTDAERVFLEALRTVRARLMDTITGLDDTIAEVEQAAAVRETVQPHLPSGATFVGETSDGGYTYRNAENRLVKVHANGQRSLVIKDNPQA